MAKVSKSSNQIADRRTLYDGAILFHEGDEAHCAYLIESGEIEILKERAGEILVLATLAKGAVFGEMALIDGGKRSATARAKSMVVVRGVDYKSLMRLKEQTSTAVWGLLQVTMERLRHTNDKLVEGATLEAED
ncbi:MAG: cyclic nucleotide-binding domain-containing protein [Rhodospirillaceae bacterium]|jgi:CRP-like cAMP-binding protein|nr:cyclic nucleotide-binding domain-containing protein [Rhodospirillaceae bacterium]MBT6136166.1 cyclic nucleotide-binding domain-containing protein [Rhodospirillaceae bacterium]